MKHFTLFFGISIGLIGNSQTFTTQTLAANNVAIQLNDGAVFGHDEVGVSPGYELPKGSGLHLLYASSFWFGGVDMFGTVRISAQTYDLGTDQFKGAYNTPFSAGEPNNPPNFPKSIWTVDKATIDFHKLNYASTGYVVPDALLDWPAHGDMASSESFYLAPFIDVDGDGIYDPTNGDYPNIRGDEATYIIMNDKAAIHSSSGGEVCGLEIHYMFYQYASNPLLVNTTFVNVRVINRSTITIPEFIAGNFLDIDLGDGSDDFIGCDSTLNMAYGYNGDAADDAYGTNPPAFGLVSLNNDLHGVVSYPSGAGSPSTAAEYFNILDGRKVDGSFQIAGGDEGGFPTRFSYNGHPDSTTHWNETYDANIPSDRRLLASVTPVFLGPDDEVCYDFAYIFNDAHGTNLKNAEGLYEVAEETQEWYDEQWRFNCQAVTLLSTAELEEEQSISIYPNPSQDGFSIATEQGGEIHIYALNGKLVYQSLFNPNELIQHNLESGTYVVAMTINGQRSHRRITVID